MPPSSSSICARMIVVHVRLGPEAERQCPLRVEIARPASDDLDDDGVRLAADERDGLLAGDAAKRRDLSPTVTERPGMVRLRLAPRPDVSRPAACRRNCDGGARARDPMPHVVRHRQDRFLCRPGARAGCRRRTRTPPCWACRAERTIVGRRMPTPSRKPRRE